VKRSVLSEQARRVSDPKVVPHRAGAPFHGAAHVHAGNEPTVVETQTDVVLEDSEPTSIRQLSERDPLRSPQEFEHEASACDAEPRGRSPRPRTSRPDLRPDLGPDPVAPTEPAPVVLAPGGRIGKYELRQKLGMGTFGLVFTARDLDLDRDVAFKVLNPTHVTNRDVVLRFLQEARASARIQHPGIVTVFDFGRLPSSLGETAFITMELLQGESLANRLNRSGRLAPEVACELARQIASALDAAHRADVLHRDLKPENIYLVPDPAVPSGERAKVIDFGLAKLGRNGHTMSNTIFGTPRYMSPEQCRSSGEIDQRSDVYSLGCILFELLTGRTPFDGDLRQLIDRHQRAMPPRAKSFAPEISQGLDDLIDSMLAKDPAARPQTMAALQRALQVLGATSVGAAETLLPQPALLLAMAPVAPVAAAQAAHASGPHAFETTDAEILVPAQQAAPRRNPALMLPPEGRRRRARGIVVAAAVAFVFAGLLTAIATRATEVNGSDIPPQVSPAQTSRAP
jgi:serine/threonine protein kinase